MLYSNPVQGDLDNYLSLLSAAQIETLPHVYEHKNSKQIARLNHVSQPTVDERVRRVIKQTNVSNRREAAIILAVHGGFANVTPTQPYNRRPWCRERMVQTVK